MLSSGMSRHVAVVRTDVISEVFMAVTMKNAIFWDVMPSGSYKSHMA
jgi:hypothetical protein